MDRDFNRQNEESRERLARLVNTLTPGQLFVDLGEGWNVASALAHMGFWDSWQAEHWELILAGKWTADQPSVDEAEHLANLALHPYWSRAFAADLPKLALEAATRVDALIASAPDELAEKLENPETSFLLHRHRHRDEHIDHIERSIAAAAASASSDALLVERNAASRRCLAEVVARLRPEDLVLPAEPSEEGSWTVAQLLGHIAFWDRSTLARWEMARDAAGPDGPIDPGSLPPLATEAVNRPLAHLLAAWTERLGRALGEEAVSAAEELDAAIAELAPRMPAALKGIHAGLADRSIHRYAHLGQIERALSARRA